jgi:hypothetical protein
MNSVGRTIVGVLGLWHGLASVQNVFDVLASTNVAPGLRPLASNNLELVAKLVAPLRVTKPALVILVSGASAIEAAASIAFARGAFARGAFARERADAGFALSLTLFGTFFLIDDAFDDYELGAKHRAIFALLAAAYVATWAAAE